MDSGDDHTLSARKSRASSWFLALQSRLCAQFEALEDAAPAALYGAAPGRFELTPWTRGEGGEDLGGGRMGLLRGRFFEKAGIHHSEVHGTFSEAFAANIPGADASGGRFWASGISLIAHPRNPFVPSVHMNTRMLVTSGSWFGGGADLTPLRPEQRRQDHPDAQSFHKAMEAACAPHPQADYQSFKEQCDAYFHLAHRNEPRGVGGIFYDRLSSGDWDADFAFTRDVGLAFERAYAPIAAGHMHTPWTAADREAQLVRRGRYVEFNLLYDRGTTFGLKTGGNVHSILSSMPPLVAWP